MKKSALFAALVLGLAAVACSPKEATTEGEGDITAIPEKLSAKDFEPTKATVDSVSYLLGLNFGSMLKGNDFEGMNYNEMVKGMKDFMNAEGNFNDPDFGEQFKINPEKMNAIINAFLENRYNYKKCLNKEEGEKFLASNKTKNGVQETESGLQYKIINPGSDEKIQVNDTISVKYCGKFIDGEVFDEVAEDAEPVEFPLTPGGLIKGWIEGLQFIGEGGEIELYVPSDLAYGEGNRGMEPNKTLIFNVKVDKVSRYVEPAADAE